MFILTKGDSMAKTKTFKLPKYLRLVKGIMWMDIDGSDASGVRLYRNTEMMVGRGNDISRFEEVPLKDKKYGDDRYPELKLAKRDGNSEVVLDEYKNNNSSEGGYGSITVEKDSTSVKSWFCTDDIPKENLTKILTAFNNGILIKHDPKKELEVPEEKPKARDFQINKDGDVVFTGKNKAMYSLLMQKNFAQVKEFITDAGGSSRQNLMDMYQYELKGFNKLNRPRAEVLDLIRNKLGKFGGGISAITTNDIDDEE